MSELRWELVVAFFAAAGGRRCLRVSDCRLPFPPIWCPLPRLYGALVFVVFQGLLRLPWLLPLNIVLPSVLPQSVSAFLALFCFCCPNGNRMGTGQAVVALLAISPSFRAESGCRFHGGGGARGHRSPRHRHLLPLFHWQAQQQWGERLGSLVAEAAFAPLCSHLCTGGVAGSQTFNGNGVQCA